MRNPRFLPLLAALACAASCFAEDTPAPAAVAPIEAVAAKLPPEVGAAARKWLREDDRELRAFLAFSAADLEREVMLKLATEPDAAAFVLGRLKDEPPATDIKILKVVVFEPFWITQPGLSDRLQGLAQATPDPELMLAYLDAERRTEDRRLRAVLDARIAAARATGDAKALAILAAADERWILLQRGASMPGYMRRPPALFAAGSPGQSVRLVGMGDFGSGAQAQRDVAAAIVRMGAERPFDLGLTFGDNFYPSGMTGIDDPRWRDWWESLYGPLHVTFYPTLGNHEWYSDDGAAAEIAYRSPTWFFPAPYYTFTAGPVQFFAIDTTEISEAEVLWLDKAIAAGTTKWKVVYGHHPIFAPENSARNGAYMAYMQARLWPVLRGRVDAYLCGHQHAMAHMDAREGVHFFMSGGGGAPLSTVSRKAPGTEFAESTFGFLTLEADAARMKISIFDTDGKAFDSEVMAK
jgi:tartrate-resistant acid phosphatase type 5